MNDRELDLLIQHAFGDAEGDEAAEAAQIAARSPKEAALWAELKSDLRALNDVPECQMSVDRLRYAVLNKAKKESTKGWSMAKIFGGLTAVAASAFAIIMAANMKDMASPESIVRPEADSHVAMMSEPTAETRPNLTKELAKPAPKTTIQDEPEPQAQAEARSRQVIQEKSSRQGLTPSPPTEEADRDLAPQTASAATRDQNHEAGLASPGGREAAFSPYTQPMTMTTNPEDSVVIVESSINQDGTRQAVEKSRNDADVVFGG